jgi:Protein of unknown function (DUF938).
VEGVVWWLPRYNELTAWAGELSLQEIIDMPANNHMLIWQKR